MKIKMIADAEINGKGYKSGRKYTVSDLTYKSLKQSCIIDTGEEPETKSMTTESLSLKPKGNKRRLNNILVVKSFGIGNIINITPTLIKLREHYPDAIIDLMVQPNYTGVLKGWNVIDSIITADQYKDIYDIVIYGTPGKIPYDIFNPAKLIKPSHKIDWNVHHEVEVNINLLNQIGIDTADIPDTQMKLKKVSGFDGKYIGICAGYLKGFDPAWQKKNWGYKNYAQLIKLLLKKYPEHTVLIFGTDNDDDILKHLPKNIKRVKNLVNKYEIQKSAYIINKCDMFISNDTGLAHIASALKVKTYVIFGATGEVKNRPWNGAEIISRDIDCRPCHHTSRFLSCEVLECMNIAPQEVFNTMTREYNNTYNVGIMMTVWGRYELLAMTLNNIINSTLNNSDVKICITDDGSNDKLITGVMSEFKKAFKGYVELIVHEENWNRLKYWKTLQDNFNKLTDCEYILVLPPDAVFNYYLYDVILKTADYMKGDIKAVSYFIDSRGVDIKVKVEEDLYKPKGEYNEHFNYVRGIDGFVCLIKKEFLIDFDWRVETDGARTKIWWKIIEALDKHKVLLYKESLAEHVGNVCSAMWENARKMQPIHSINLNLFNKPAILIDKPKEKEVEAGFDYSKEWYENEYHSKGDYFLKDRDYKEVMDRWEKAGYKERLIKVFGQIRFKNDFECLEIACHHGKTVFWLLDVYSPWIKNYDAFDFSKVAVDWCNKYNPFPDRAVFKTGDVTNIPFKKSYDLITCIDVTEHLPIDIYWKLVNQIKLRLKKGGLLVLMGGTALLPEHINIKQPAELIEDFEGSGFKFIKELGDNHILFTKE